MLLGNDFASQFYIFKLLAFFDVRFWQVEACEPKEAGQKLFFKHPLEYTFVPGFITHCSSNIM